MFVQFVFLWLGLSAQSGLAASAIEVPAPCSDVPSATVWRKCSDVISHADNGNLGKGLLKALDARIKTQVEKFYTDGRSVSTLDPTDQCTGEECVPGASYNFVKPVCSLTPNSLNGCVAEETTNHNHSESCGDFIEVKIPSADLLQYDLTGNHGKRERSWFGGIYVQALSFFLAQVKDEVKNTRKLKIAAASPCAILGQDVANLGRQSDNVAKALRDNLGSQANGNDIWKCEADWDPSDVKVGMDVGKLRQSAQQLCAARSGQEAMFTQLMVCEVVYRTKVAFKSSFVSLDDFRGKVEKYMDKKCEKLCEDSCSSACGIVWNPAPSWNKSRCLTCYQGCSNQCYRRELLNYIKETVAPWTSGGTCTPISELESKFIPTSTREEARVC